VRRSPLEPPVVCCSANMSGESPNSDAPEVLRELTSSSYPIAGPDSLVGSDLTDPYLSDEPKTQLNDVSSRS